MFVPENDRGPSALMSIIRHQTHLLGNRCNQMLEYYTTRAQKNQALFLHIKHRFYCLVFVYISYGRSNYIYEIFTALACMFETLARKVKFKVLKTKNL